MWYLFHGDELYLQTLKRLPLHVCEERLRFLVPARLSSSVVYAQDFLTCNSLRGVRCALPPVVHDTS